MAQKNINYAIYASINRNHYLLLSKSFLFFFWTSKSAFSSCFLFWPSSIFCCPSRNSFWFIFLTHNFRSLLPSSTSFSAASVWMFKLEIVSSILFHSSSHFFCLFGMSTKIQIIPLSVNKSTKIELEKGMYPNN